MKIVTSSSLLQVVMFALYLGCRVLTIYLVEYSLYSQQSTHFLLILSNCGVLTISKSYSIIEYTSSIMDIMQSTQQLLILSVSRVLTLLHNKQLVEYFKIVFRPLTLQDSEQSVEYSPLSIINNWQSISYINVVYSPCKILNSLWSTHPCAQ